MELESLQCFLAGMAIYAFQLLFSNLWIKHYYYGPLEWLWRTGTWFKIFPLKRKK